MLAGVRYANDQKGWFQWHSFMNDFTHLALSWKKLNCEIWRMQWTRPPRNTPRQHRSKIYPKEPWVAFQCPVFRNFVGQQQQELDSAQCLVGTFSKRSSHPQITRTTIEQHIQSTPPCLWNLYTDCVVNVFIFFVWNSLSVEIRKNAWPQPKRPPKLQVSRHPRPAMWNKTKH